MMGGMRRLCRALQILEVVLWRSCVGIGGAEYLKESFEVYHNIPRIPISPPAISVILMVQVPFLAGALSHEGLSNFARVWRDYQSMSFGETKRKAKHLCMQ